MRNECVDVDIPKKNLDMLKSFSRARSIKKKCKHFCQFYEVSLYIFQNKYINKVLISSVTPHHSG